MDDPVVVQKAFRPTNRVSKSFDGKTRTKQEFKKQCDINCVLKRYDKSGLITHVNSMKGDYGDFSNTDDYHSSMNMVIAARESFMELPSAIRKRFDHDAGKFLEFVTNPDNADDLVEMGLARAPEPPPDPVKVEVINSDSSE